jgi:hypothetical protein
MSGAISPLTVCLHSLNTGTALIFTVIMNTRDSARCSSTYFMLVYPKISSMMQLLWLKFFSPHCISYLTLQWFYPYPGSTRFTSRWERTSARFRIGCSVFSARPMKASDPFKFLKIYYFSLISRFTLTSFWVIDVSLPVSLYTQAQRERETE